MDSALESRPRGFSLDRKGESILSISCTFTIAGEEAGKFKERIRQEALNQGLSMSEYIVKAVKAYLYGGDTEPAAGACCPECDDIDKGNV